jgi:Ca2+-binding EF-hand superfamily protein
LQAIAERHSFKELDLSENELGSHEFALKCKETAAVALGNMLARRSCTLETLKLSWNMIRFKSGVFLARSLALNTSLTHLDLSYNRLCDQGGDALGDALHSNRTLRVLNLAHNNITSRPCCTILSGAVSCESLTELDLSRNPIGEYGARLLLSVDLKYGHRLRVDNRNCTVRVRDNSCWFDPLNPKMEYTLHLNEPYERCVCIELLRKLMQSKCALDALLLYQYKAPEDSEYRDIVLGLYDSEEAAAAAETAKAFQKSLQSASTKSSPVTSHKQFEPDTRCSILGDFLTAEETEAKLAEARLKFRETCDSIFRQYDTDNSGGLDCTELAAILDQMGIEGSVDMVDKLLSIYDADGSGIVEEEEFIQFLQDFKANADFNEGGVASDERFFYINTMEAGVGSSKKNMKKPAPYLPPNVGTVHIKLDVTKVKSSSQTIITRRNVESMLDTSKFADDRSALFDYALNVLTLQFEEAQALYRVMLKEIGSVLHVITRLLPRMASPHDARMLITYVTGNEFEQMHLLRMAMGPQFFVLIGIPNGFYRLNMAEAADRDCFKELARISNANAEQREKSNMGDTSQDGNFSSFRNSVFDGKAFKITKEFIDHAPDKGRLEFDFVSLSSGSLLDTEISNFRFHQLMVSLGMTPADNDKRKRLFERMKIETTEARQISKGVGYRPTEMRATVMEQAANHLHKLYATYALVREPQLEMEITEAEMPYIRSCALQHAASGGFGGAAGNTRPASQVDGESSTNGGAAGAAITRASMKPTSAHVPANEIGKLFGS